MTGRLGRTLAVLAVVGAAASGTLAQVRADNPGHYREGEYDQIRNVLPAGQTGFLSPTDVVGGKLAGSTAPHTLDQLGMYTDLVKHAPGITAADISRDYKDASFGVAPDQIASTESPRPGLTIIRDKQFGVPHIYGVTDADLVYGTGWALGEDRLFFTDVLRHYGRSTLASFIGPSRASIAMDCAQAQLTGYNEQELTDQVTSLPAPYPSLAQSYIDGVNAYIDATLTDPTKLPAEYLAFGLRPAHWNTGDIIAIAGLVGGIFGKGGGTETRNSAFLRALYSAYGGPGNPAKSDPAHALSMFNDFMENNDPAAPTTLDTPFPYELNVKVDPKSVALTKDAPGDPLGSTCTVSPSNVPLTQSSPALPGGMLSFPSAMSNALLVDAQHSTTGRPIAVFGPQVGYFAPQVLMEEDLHSPSYNVEGASFPGTNFIVELGHGPDYAWSATSAGTDNIDQRAERLCNPSSPDPLQNVDPQSTNYMFDGRCVAMLERTQTETALPTAGSLNTNPSSSTPLDGAVPRQVTIKIERTVHGPVLSRTTALVDGVEVPVAISTQRSTFLHEADSIEGFARYNNPAQMRNAQDFLVAASKIRYTFNWFYIDDRDIAYYQSGLLPIRTPGASPLLPTWGTGEWEWQGWLGFDAHVHAINPPRGWMTSWNNKGAPQFRASDDQWSYGMVHRSQSLSNEIAAYLARQGGRMSLVDLDNAMASAATVDLRGTQLLPDLLQLVGGDQSVAPQVALLSSWLSKGAHRRDRAGSGAYEDVKAIELYNAWYPKLLHAIFEPALGTAFSRVPEGFDDAPGGRGSSYISGWYGYVQKSLHMALGEPVAQPYSQQYCGNGDRAACTAALVDSLKAAASAAAAADDTATTRADDIHFAVVGLESVPAIPWQNRPTLQQVVDIPGHRQRDEAATGGGVAPQTGGLVPSTPNTGRALGGAAISVTLVAVAALAATLRRRRRA